MSTICRCLIFGQKAYVAVDSTASVMNNIIMATQATNDVLRICSYNCEGIKNSEKYISTLKDYDIEVSHADITSGIEGLANNKSCGFDGVSAEHLKHSSNRIVPVLAMCFTGFFIHGMLPPSMISVVLVPIVKDKRASVCST